MKIILLSVLLSSFSMAACSHKHKHDCGDHKDKTHNCADCKKDGGCDLDKEPKKEEQKVKAKK